MLDRLKRFFSSRFASYSIILLACIERILQKIHFTEPAGDRIFQIQATKNLVDGNGISIYEAFLQNLSHAQHSPLINWPPGYSLLLAPFYAVCGERFFWGSLLLDALACFVFILVARKTIQLFQLPAWQVNFYTLVTGFTMYAFTMFGSSDFISLVFFQIGLFLLLRSIANERKNFKIALLIAFSLFAAGLVRFMFIPIVLIIPVYLIAYGWINRKRDYLRTGLIIFSTLILLDAGLLLFQQIYSGTALYHVPSEKGFFPFNLLRMEPFFFSSILHLQLTTSFLSNISHQPYLAIRDILGYINFLFFLIAIFFFLKWLFRKKMQAGSTLDHFLMLGSFASLLVIGLLGYLTLTQEPVRLSGGSLWTFIDEPRYYSIPIVFVQQILFIAFSRRHSFTNPWRRTILFLPMLILLITTLHGMIYTARIVLNRHKGIYFQQDRFKFMEYLKERLETTIAQNPGRSPVIFSIGASINNYAALWKNIPGLYYDKDETNESIIDEKLNSFQFSSENPTLLFIVVSQMNQHKVQGLIANPATRHIGHINDFDFYLVLVDP